MIIQTQQLLLLPWLLTAVVVVVDAQESPFAVFPKFTEGNGTFRTHVCERQGLLFDNQIQLRDALQGLNLSVAITNYQFPNEDKFFTLKYGNKIKETDPGLFVVILDEVAKRAGFSWRNSFVGIDPVTAADNKTWTNLLEWEVENFDIAVDYWARSIIRISKGISFPHGWYDGSIVMASLDPTINAKNVNLWSFLKPFEYSVWIGILLAIVFTGFMYFIMERLRADSDERELEDKPLASIFLAAITFTGHFEFRPDSNAARLLAWSWSFWALVISAAYTANMASFLVSQNKAVTILSTVEDAIQSQTPICVQRGAVIDDILSEQYPQLILVRKDSELEVFQGLRKSWYGGGGGCGAMLNNLGTLEVYQSQAESNPDCSLTSEKRVVLNLPAGFATAIDSGIYCTSLISYVLDVHLQEMRADGFIDNAWKNHLAGISTVDCSAVQNREKRDENARISLSLEDMGGIFITHGMLSSLAVLVALWQYFYTKFRKPTKKLRPLLKSLRKVDKRKVEQRQMLERTRKDGSEDSRIGSGDDGDDNDPTSSAIG